MSEIPDDIRKTAEACLHPAQWNPATVEIIGRAVLAEREKCKRVLLDAAAEHQSVAENDEWHTRVARYLRRLAAAIRTPSTGEEQ